MAEACALDLAGEPVRLFADRALYWPARQRLLVADLHLGKGDLFRAAGIPVPTGGTVHDLRRLDALLRDTGATALWILGDFLHGPRNAPLDATWRAFREAHPRIDMAVMRGNHDRAFDPTVAGVRTLDDGMRDGPFTFHHAPPVHDAGATHAICGHVHPVVRLPGAGRFPLFWLQPQTTVLPAFSRFSGGFQVPARECRGSLVCHGDGLLRLT